MMKRQWKRTIAYCRKQIRRGVHEVHVSRAQYDDLTDLMCATPEEAERMAFMGKPIVIVES